MTIIAITGNLKYAIDDDDDGGGGGVVLIMMSDILN